MNQKTLLISHHWLHSVVLSLAFLLISCLAFAENPELIAVYKNSSVNFDAPETIKTIVIGNPNLVKVNIVKSDLLIINGVEYGNTSMSLFGKSGEVYEYKIQVSRDLSFLRKYLKRIDSRIDVSQDPNGDGIILFGTAKDQNLINQAEAITVKFLGQFEATYTETKPKTELTQDYNPNGLPTNKDNFQQIQGPDKSSITVTSKVKTTSRVINLIINENTLIPAPLRLEALLKEIDKRISVEEVNGVFLLKGEVKNGASLTRAIALADRFVTGGEEKPDFSVVSDKGGVLAGNTEETQQVMPVPPQVLGAGNGRNNRNGRNGNGNGNSGAFGGGFNGGGFGGGGNGNNGRGGVNNNNRIGGVMLSPNKGNIAQNIARGDVVTAAGGRVMSYIKLEKNPRVEVQMRIVGVDRNKTEDLGIDWRLISTNTSNGKSTGVSIGSFLGNVVDELPGIDSSSSDGIDSGSSTLVLGAARTTAERIITLSSFIRWVETKGAAKTLTEPLLTALSGESATFSVGGTLPVLTQDQTTFSNNGVTQNTSTNITYLQYGLGIVVRPTVLENGKISLVLDQTLSEPDYNVAVTGFQSAQIPGFKTRNVNTITESSSGETWAVAGLLNEEDTNTTKAVPYLSNIPVLGWLFRNENKGKVRKELLIVVTARLIDDDGTMITSGQLSGKSEKDTFAKSPELPAEKLLSEQSPVNIPQNQTAAKIVATEQKEQSKKQIVIEDGEEFIVETRNNHAGPAAFVLDNSQNYYKRR